MNFLAWMPAVWLQLIVALQFVVLNKYVKYIEYSHIPQDNANKCEEWKLFRLVWINWCNFYQ